jgi:hypothetical protein
MKYQSVSTPKRTGPERSTRNQFDGETEVVHVIVSHRAVQEDGFIVATITPASRRLRGADQRRIG